MATYDININAKDNTGRVLGKVERNLNKLNRTPTGGGVAGQLKNMRVAALGAAAAVGVVGAAVAKAGQATLAAGVTFTNYRNKLSLITKGTADLNNTMNRLSKLAVENRTAFGDTVQLFTNLKLATEDLGFSTGKVEKLTSKLSQALQVSGADAATTSSVIRQFGQAMASGTVRGDEFNSLVEGLGPALSIMARESGITVGQLREMSQAGELTAEAMSDILLNSNELTASFEKMKLTVPQLKTQLDDAFTRLLADVSQFLGLEDKVSDFYKNLTRAAQEASRSMTGEEFLTTDQLTSELEDAQTELTKFQNMLADTSYLNMAASILPFIGSKTDWTEATEGVSKYDGKVKELSERLRKMRLLDDENLVMEQSLIAQSVQDNAARIQKEMDDEDLVMGVEVAPKGTYAEYAKSLMDFATRGIRDVERELADEEIVMGQFVAAPGVSSILAASVKRKADAVQKYMDDEDLAMSLPVNLKIESISELKAQALQARKDAAQAVIDEDFIMSLPVMTSLMVERLDEENKQRIHRMLKAEDLMFSIPVTVNPDIYIGKSQIQNLTQRLSDEELAMSIPLGNLPSGPSAESKTFLAASEIAQTLAERQRELAEANRKTQESADELAARQRDLENTSLQVAIALGEEKRSYDNLNATLNDDRAIKRLAKTYGVETSKLIKALTQARDAMDNFKSDAVTVSGVIKGVWETMGDNMASGIAKGIMKGEGLFNSFKGFLKNFANEVITQILQKMLIQPMIDQMVNFGSALMGGASVSSAAGGMGGGINFGSLLSGITGFFSQGGGMGNMLSGLWGGVSSFFSNIFGGMFADGGYLPAGKVGIAGEAGPELISGPARITSNEDSFGGGGALTVNFNINAISTSDGTQFILEHKREIEGVIQGAYNKRGKQGIYN